MNFCFQPWVFISPAFQVDETSDFSVRELFPVQRRRQRRRRRRQRHWRGSGSGGGGGGGSIGAAAAAAAAAAPYRTGSSP